METEGVFKMKREEPIMGLLIGSLVGAVLDGEDGAIIGGTIGFIAGLLRL